MSGVTIDPPCFMNFINFDKASNDKVMIGSTSNVKFLLQLIIISQKAVIRALTVIHCPAEPNPIFPLPILVKVKKIRTTFPSQACVET